MRGPGVTIDAPVLAAAVRIDAVLEPDIRAVVAADDLAAVVAQEESARQRVLLRVLERFK